MTKFEQITKSPLALGDFLKSIPVLEGPWDKAFYRIFCEPCSAENCDSCPHEWERDNPVWWLCLPDCDDEEHMVELDMAKLEHPMTPEEEAEMERMSPLFRYCITDAEELTETQISEMDVSEQEKAVYKFLAKSNPEKRVMEISACNGNVISLHGLTDVEFFMKQIREHAKKHFSMRSKTRKETQGMYAGLKDKVEKIAENYADLIDQRIRSATKSELLDATVMTEINEGIRMLGHVAATLERIVRLNRGNDTSGQF